MNFSEASLLQVLAEQDPDRMLQLENRLIGGCLMLCYFAPAG